MKNTPDGAGVDRVDIRGKVDGIQLEAARRHASPPADSTPRRGASAAMSAPEWIRALGDRDPSVAIALAAITRAAGAERRGGVRRPGHELPRGPPRLLPGAAGPAQAQEITGDEVRDHLGQLGAARGWPPRAGFSTVGRRRLGPGAAAGAPGGAQTSEDRQAVYGALLAAARRAAQRVQAAGAAARLDQRARGHATWRRASRAAGSSTR